MFLLVHCSGARPHLDLPSSALDLDLSGYGIPQGMGRAKVEGMVNVMVRLSKAGLGGKILEYPPPAFLQ